MRSTILLSFLLLAGSLAGQEYFQNSIPVQQAQPASDCYTRNLDNGNAALRRGESREALRLFNEAKNCPDAQGNIRRQTEIDSRIVRCQELLGLTKAFSNDKQIDLSAPKTTQKRNFSNDIPVSRRNFAANQAFLKDTAENCFHRMAEEADRAFRLRFWEDAAALYRAAKNCNDADQKARQEMSEKITACRDAAENELFAKQQEAERQARHAIAANLADDAQELLRTTDRSLAFRLADFANQYIAPEDNPDCVQAMFDAWYYQPSEDSKRREDQIYHPVFCYELADNLGENVQVKFEVQKDGKQWLWAFLPNNGNMIAWEMPGMELVQVYGTGEANDFQGFDLTPARDILFWGYKFFEIRRGMRSHRVQVPSVSKWCFNGRGDEFFYENTLEQKIYVLNVREAFAQQSARKGTKSTNLSPQTVVAREIVSGIPSGLLAMEYVDGKFWLAYRDRIEVLSKMEAGKPWIREKTILFEGVDIPDDLKPEDIRIVLFPREGFAVLGIYDMGWTIPIALDQDSPYSNLKTRHMDNLSPVAVAPLENLVACKYSFDYIHTGFWLMDTRTGDTLLHQQVQDNAELNLLQGSFSTDARWIAVATPKGDIKVWALKDAPTMASSTLPILPDDLIKFSPNGKRLFVPHADTLAILQTNGSDNPDHFWKNNGVPLRGASDHWAMVQVSADSAEARHLTDGRRLRFPLENPDAYSFLYTFDTKGEKYVAYLSSWSRVELRSLKTGALVASKVFEGGSIGDLQFIPNSDNLLVVMHNNQGSQSSVKIWAPLRKEEKPRVLRLHEYYVESVTIDGSGTLGAFSNGLDIRIFDLRNPENEALKIRENQSITVRAIAFQANSKFIAAAYSDGKVIFWNSQTGQPSLELQAILDENIQEKNLSIAFSNNGTLLHLATSDGQMIVYALDPSYIRSVVQNENRKLQPFGVEHIVRYNLEAALFYPGNFERLAESDDTPLIRTFFQYFGGQALESNNITQVRNYCERAFFLYERLGANTRELWESDMNRMYEDYAWKLLLRGNIKEATSVVSFIKRQFQREPLQLQAHLALFRRDCTEAGKYYSTWFLTEGDGIPSSYESSWRFEQTENELSQLLDYEVIDSFQANCFCEIVQYSGAFQSFCPESKTATTTFLSPADQLRWEIFQKRNATFNTARFARKIELLKDAHQKAKQLLRAVPARAQVWEETIRLELAKAQRDLGVFERYSPEAPLHFQEAAQLLQDDRAFRIVPDTARLSLLASTHLAWGKYLLDQGKAEDAATQLNQGLSAISSLAKLILPADSIQLINYYDNLAGPLYEKIGTAFLMAGHTSEAGQAYEQASTFYYTYGFSSRFRANVAVFQGDDTQALIDYGGGIFSAYEMADVLFELSRLAERFPEQGARLEEFGGRLRSSIGATNQRLANVEVDYWFANRKMEYFNANSQWDSAIVWSRIVLQTAKKCADLPNTGPNWISNWLDAHINLSYYLLLGAWDRKEALEECIKLAEIAEAYMSNQAPEDFYYANQALLKTNDAHARLLRNDPGDRKKAIALYQSFLQEYADPRGYDNLEMLEKDFRDLKRVGANIPAIPELETGSED